MKWDIPLLDGYKHVFLPRLRDGQDVSFAMPLNYGIVSRLRGSGGEPAFDALWVHGYATAECAARNRSRPRPWAFPCCCGRSHGCATAGAAASKLALKNMFFAGLEQVVDAVSADRNPERRVLATLLWRRRYRSS